MTSVTVRVLTERDYVRMPWLNGGGMATEFVKTAVPASRRGPDEDFLWRLSDADIDRSGPFSNYPGIDRHFMLFEGNGVVFDFGGNGGERLDENFRFLSFDGGWKTHCELIDGPVRAFNLQVTRRHAASKFQVIEAGDAATEREFPAMDAKGASTRLVFILEGEAAVTVDREAMALPTRATLVVEQGPDAPMALTLSGKNFRAVLVDIFERQA